MEFDELVNSANARELADGGDLQSKRNLVCEALELAGPKQGQRVAVFSEFARLAPADGNKRFLELSSHGNVINGSDSSFFETKVDLSSVSKDGATGHTIVEETYGADGHVKRSTCVPDLISQSDDGSKEKVG